MIPMLIQTYRQIISMSFFKELNIAEPNIILCSTNKFKKMKVILPSKLTLRDFGELSFVKEMNGTVKFYNPDNLCEPIYIFQSWNRLVRFSIDDTLVEYECNEFLKEDCEALYYGKEMELVG